MVSGQKPVSLSVSAECEILEVLLNEPQLFEDVKGYISAEEFGEPTLKKIAIILFEALKTARQLSLTQILAKVESIEVSNAITTLAHRGYAKGNYQKRLTGAKEVLQRLKKKKQIERLHQMNDSGEIFRNVCENPSKTNRHSLGMR